MTALGRAAHGRLVGRIVLMGTVSIAASCSSDSSSEPTPSSAADAAVGTVVSTPPSGSIESADTEPTMVLPASADMLKDFFPIGVDFQHPRDFERWRRRGVNSLVRNPFAVDVNTWADAADAAGFMQIRPPRVPASADVGNPWLLAWMYRDEPDLVAHQIPTSELDNQYDEWKAIDPHRNVLVNVTGSMNQHDVDTGEGGDEWYATYFATADWVSGDIYPVNRGRPLTIVGDMVDRMQSIVDYQKPVFAVIEASDYDTTNEGGAPNADQFRAEVWHAIIHGVRGIWYLAVQVEPNFVYDAVPEEVATAMPELHRRITGLQEVLQGPIDPPELDAHVDGPLEVAWRLDESSAYFIVLNLSDEARADEVIELDGIGTATRATVYEERRTIAITDGAITDDFGPYEAHVYHVETD